MTHRCARAALFSVVATAFALGSIAAQTAGNGAVLRVEEDHVDVGTVFGGKPVTATFVLFNDSDHEIRILKAAPS